jgi:hypothetical protein
MGLTRPRFHQVKESDYKNSCRVATTENITLSGGAPATVDSVNLQVGDRVLVTGQTTANQNGIYVVSTLGSGSNGTWSRAIDAAENADVTSVSEPYIFKVGDMVRNINPSCTHFGSMGIIQKLLTLPNDMGTLVKYTVTNNGDMYSAGDSLTKTMDQLTLAHDGEEIDFDDYSDDLDDYDVVDYDFGNDADDDDWEDGEDYEYYDDEEDEEEEEDELEEASNPSFKDRQLIDKFAKWVGEGNTPTSTDIDYYSQLKKLTPEEKYLLKKTFLPDIKIKSTGTTPDTRYRFR